MESHTYNSIATLLTLLTLIASTRPAAGTTSSEFIRRSCSSTSYPTLCFSSLSSHANAIQQDPKLLANVALSVSLQETRATSVGIVKMAHGARLSPREASAMKDCVEELRNSVDQLQKSMAEMGHVAGSNFWAVMSDVQTWVSAALTNEDTCMDGFAMNGPTKTAVRGKILNVVHTTSNALALINSYAALHG